MGSIQQGFRRLGGAVASTALVAVAVTSSMAATFVLGATPTATAAGSPTTCGYGTGGFDASAICWLDWTSYSDTTARGGAGQAFTVSLGGGYTMSFTLAVTAPQGTTTSNPSTYPVTPVSAYGTTVYTGTPGKPAVHSEGTGPWTVVDTLRNIAVTDSAGAPVTGWTFVLGDPQGTNSTERDTWTSTAPINILANIPASGSAPNGCENNTTGGGTTTVVCTGTAPGAANSHYGSVVAGTTAPTTFSAQLQETSNAFLGASIAIGVMTSKLTLTKSVVSRTNPSDSFDVNIADPGGSTIGTATTGATHNSATAGPVTVPVTGGAYTLSEAATAGSGTDLTKYNESWSCSNSTSGSSTVLPSGGGTSKTVTPAPGDNITCLISDAGGPTLPVNLVYSTDGGKTWTTTPTVTIGQPVLVRVYTSNTTNVPLNGTQLTSALPAGFSLVPGSTKVCLNPGTAAPDTNPTTELACNTDTGQGGAITESAVWSGTTPGSTLGISPTAGLMTQSPAGTTGYLQVGESKFLNLDQCNYYGSAADSLTYFVPSTPNTPPFSAGTTASNTAQTAPNCGPGTGPYTFQPVNSGAQNIPLLGQRYLNLNQCLYRSTDGLTYAVSTGTNPGFTAATTTSNALQASPTCGGGNSVSYPIQPTLSGVANVDLLGNSVLNLNQCAYFGTNADELTYVVPSTSNTSFGAATSASNANQAAPGCLPGAPGFFSQAGNSGVGNINLVDTTRGQTFVQFAMTPNACSTATVTQPGGLNGPNTGNPSTTGTIAVSCLPLGLVYSTDGGATWTTTPTVATGAQILVRLYTNNPTPTTLSGTQLSSALPPGFSLVSGSTKVCLNPGTVAPFTNPTPETACNTDPGQGGAITESAVWSGTTPGSTLTIGPTAGVYGQPVNGTTGDLAFGKTRFFNFANCNFTDGRTDDYETWVPVANPGFAVQPTVSNTASGQICPPGGGGYSNDENTMINMHLLGLRFLNLDQCDYDQTAVGNNFDTLDPSTTSNTPITAGNCAPSGNPGTINAPGNSNIGAFDLLNNRVINLHECDWLGPPHTGSLSGQDADNYSVLLSASSNPGFTDPTNVSNSVDPVTPNFGCGTPPAGTGYTFIPGNSGQSSLDTTDTTRGQEFVQWTMAAPATCVPPTVTQPGALTGTGTGNPTTSGTITVFCQVPYTLTTTADPSQFLAGSVSDTATLTGLTSGGGSVTFKAFGPSEAPTCTTPVFTSGAIPVPAGSGTATVSSGAFTPATPGAYYWIASYTGGTNLTKDPAISTHCGDVGKGGNGVGADGEQVVIPQPGAWILQTDMPSAQSDNAAASGPCPAFMNDRQGSTCLYEGGGADISNNPSSAFQVMDPTIDTWASAAALPTAVEDTQLAAAPCTTGTGTCIYEVGGLAGAGLTAASAEYNPVTNAWTAIAALPAPEWRMRAATAPCPSGSTHTCVYIVGGQAAVAGAAIANTYAFDTTAGTWSAVANLTTARVREGLTAAPCPPGATDATCLYAVAGSPATSSSAEVYDPATNKWTAVASMPVGLFNTGAATAPCEFDLAQTCVYDYGGFTTAAVAVAYEYNPATNTWVQIPSMNVARNTLAAVDAPCPPLSPAMHCVYALGGASANGTGALISDEVFPPTAGLTLTKQVPGRVASNDQFTLSAKDAVGTTVTAVTTSGTQASATSNPGPILQGRTYTVTEAMAAGSTSSLSAYNSAIACTDTTTNAVLANFGTGNGPWTITIPTNNDNYQCTVTNTAASTAFTVSKTASTATPAPGQTVTYTVTVKNTGPVAIGAANPATFTDDLTDVLDDATFNNDAAATAGTVSFAAPTLSWTGTLAASATATITYSVRVNDPDSGNQILTNTVVPSGPGASCSASPGCTSTDKVTTAPAFSCDAFGYIFSVPTGGTASVVNQVDLASGVETKIGTLADIVNGVGYNVLDNYFYAYDITTNDLVRINQDNTLTHLPLPTGFPTFVKGANTGDVDPSGHLWLANGSDNQFAEIDFAPGSPTYGQVLAHGTLKPPTGLSGPSDWSWINGSLFYVASSTANPSGAGHLVAFNPTTGATTDLGAVGISNATIGATFTDSTFLYAFDNNTGKIFRIDPTNDATLLLSTSSPASASDGARCAKAPIPTVTVTKSVVSRLDPSDQFTVSLLNSGGTTLTSATTSGTQTSATSTNFPVSQGSSYTITDAMVAGSRDALASYSPSISCTDTATKLPLAVAGSTTPWTLAITSADPVSCTVTNTPAVNQPIVTCSSNANIFNTGFNAATGKTLPENAKDAAWQVAGPFGPTNPVTATSPPPGTAVFAPANVADLAPSAYSPSPFGNATWISQQTDASPSSPTGDWYYEYQFFLDPSVNPSSFALSMNFLADNEVAEVFVNGVAQSSQTTGLPQAPASAGNPYLFVGYTTANQASTFLNHNWQTGLNTMMVQVKSGAPAEAFDAQIRPSVLCPVAAISLTKTAEQSTYTTAGQQITYDFAVTNTGNVPLTNVTINETSFSGSPTPVPTCASPLAATATETCQVKYTVTQADLNAGSITNTATVTGTPPSGVNVTSQPSSATVTAASSPSIGITKSATPQGALPPAGQTIKYTFVVTNTGNVTLSHPTVNETTFTGSPALVLNCPTNPPPLPPQGQMTCTATYTVTQNDVNSGTVNNTATASGTPPTGAAVTSQPSSANVPGTQTPAITLTKTASPTSVTAAGQTVAYKFVITNTGNVTLTNATLTETAFSGSPTPVATCDPGAATMLPGAVVNCTASYTVTQADMDAGSITNTASVTAAPPSGANVSATSNATVSATPHAAITLNKTATPTSVAAAGQTVSYQFVVTNTGNVSLTNVGVTETAFSGSPPVVPNCTASTLAPQGVETCTATYTVTQADIDAGSITNSAQATGTPPTGPAVTATSNATVTATATPALTIKKTATPSDTLPAAGQTITYTFVVTNTGNVTLTNPTVNETAFTGSPPLAVNCPPTPSLAPQGQMTCSATYAVTTTDFNRGTVTNTATASATTPGGANVTSQPSTAAVPGTQTPSITLLKTATPSTVTTAGQTVSYKFVITNTGNVTLKNATLTETAFSGNPAPTPACDPGAASMDPGAIVNCTATYTVTQADIDAGKITNSAMVSAAPPTGSNVTATANATVAVTSAPGISLAKTANPTSVTTAGQTVTYTFAVTNTGNVTLSNITINETSFSGAPTPVPTCASPLLPNATENCTVTYTVTQADIDAGKITNSATASGTPPTGAAVTSSPSSATVTAPANASIGIVKSAVPVDALPQVGQPIDYTFVVTNTGNVTLNHPTVAETQFSGSPALVVNCPPSPPPLAPQGQMTCTATYTVTQNDFDAGTVTNTATASGTTPGGVVVTSQPSSTKTPGTQNPAISLVKGATPSTVTAAGQTVTYDFTITNAGNVTLTNATLTEGAFSGAPALAPTCDPGLASMPPGAIVHCTATYTVTQADMDAGSITNSASAFATPPSGPNVNSSSHASVTATANPALTIAKSATPSTVTTAGQTITYNFVVTNTGNVTLTNVTANETAFSGSPTPTPVCPSATLVPQQIETCSATYTVRQADIDAGSITNSATASGTPPTGPPVTSAPSDATVTVPASPAIGLVKSASPENALPAVGQPIDYTFVVTNTGNVTLGNPRVTETQFSGSPALVLNCPPSPPPLPPQGQMTCTATYTVTQNDFNTGGVVTNTATATGTPPTGPDVTSAPSSTRVPGTQTPAITLAKTATPSTVTAAGQTVTFKFSITNTGNVTLTNAHLTDGPFSGSPALSPTCDPGLSSMDPGAIVNCTATYTVLQTDIDSGSITNAASVSAQPPSGGPVTANANVTVTATQGASISLAKSASPTTVSAAGQTVTYNFDVTNSGNVTLTNVDVTETAFSGAPPISPVCASPLAPGATERCQALYTVTQNDMDAGSITNTATVTGTPPSGPAVTSKPSSATVTAAASPAISIVKSASPENALPPAGQNISYTFVVTNTGNVTLTTPTVNETQFSGSPALTINCPPTPSLAPQAQMTCTATYTVTLNDFNNGGLVTNTATASGTTPTGGTVTSQPSSARVPGTQTPAITLVKSATPSTVTAAGQAVAYGFVVTNTGNVTLTNVTLTDTAFSGAPPISPTCGAGLASMNPGAIVTCTASYITTQADIDAGQITNTAGVSATPPSGPNVTATSSATVTATSAGGLSIVKSANPTTVSSAGQPVTYDFLVTNTGNVTLTGVAVGETSFTGTAGAPTASCPTQTLAPQASVHCSATYTFTQRDIDAGKVTNTATATGKTPAGVTVTSGPSSATVTAPSNAGITIVKSASPENALPPVGQPITYTFVVTNAGNVTLTNPTVNETQFSGTPALVVNCPPTPSLAPQGQMTCHATYAVTLADINAGTVTNTATATGTTPGGGTITSAPSSTQTPGTQTPGITLSKTATPSTVTAAGQTVTYSFVMTNTGNVTLTGVVVNETAFSGAPPLAIACDPGAASMDPGAIVNCKATYTVSQADIDAGQITNTATATGTPPIGPNVTSLPANATVTIPANPSLSVVKSASPTSVTSAGQTVGYSFVVTNTGNLTLTNVTVNETAFSGSPTPTATCPSAILAPRQTETCQASYVVTQGDIDAGSITNTADVSGKTLAGATVTSPPSNAVVTAPTNASIGLVKSASPVDTLPAAGQPVHYTFVVTNTGNVTLNNPAVTETQFSGAPPVVPNCPATPTLPPQGQMTCTATYTVTTTDFNTGQLNNTAVATGTTPGGATVTSQPSSTRVPGTQTPSINLVKSASPATVTAAGQAVRYSLTVTNTGNVTLSNVNVSDTQFSGTGTPSAINCPTGALTAMAPGAQVTCFISYTVTQADLDAGSVTNTGTATGTGPAGQNESATSSATVTATQTPSLTLVKSANPSIVSGAGQSVTYGFVVTNTGNVTLTGVAVHDTAFSGKGTPPVIGCPSLVLAPQGQMTCSATYTLTQADADAGQVTNTATVSGNPPSGSPVTSAPSSAVVTVPTNSSISLVKSASPLNALPPAGQAISYTFVVTNTGNVTLNNPTVTETQFSGAPPVVPNCPATPTLPPQGQMTCTATYTVTLNDFNNGGVVTNTATASGTTPGGATVTSQPSSTRVPGTQTPSIGVAKTASPTSVSAAGQTVSYTFVITNTGNVTLTNASVTDTVFSGKGTAPSPACDPSAASMVPGAQATCRATYVVTQQDIDQGSITNTATATGAPPTGTNVTSPPSSATVTAAAVTSLTLAKSAAPTAVSGAGQTVTYSLVVTNTGNVTLSNVAVNDTAFSGQGAPPVIGCPSSALAPNGFETCSATYTTVQADADAGKVTNIAVAVGTPPAGAAIASNPSTAVVTIQANAGLSLVKSASPLNALPTPGNTVTYTFVVTNTGNVTITNPTVTETKFSGAPPVVPDCGTSPPPLSPQGQMTCTATYTVTTADFNAGQLNNTAVASGTTPGGATVTSQPASTRVPATQAPSIGLVKSVAPSTVTAAGQTVTFTYVITNTGNVSLTNAGVTETAFNGAGPQPAPTCNAAAASLLPGAQATCTATYTVVQADVNRGQITNTATATGTPPTGANVTSASSTAIVTAAASPSISLVKSAAPLNALPPAGQTISYTFVVTNTGNVTLTNPTVTETQFSGAPPVVPNCPPTPTLAPQAQMTCTATYTVTTADFNAGVVTNTAVASGTPPTGPVVTSQPSSARVPGTQTPAITLLKTASPTTVSAAGQTVTFSYLITNTGNVTLTSAVVNETTFTGAGPQPTPTCNGAAASLTPGAQATCTATYTVLQADMDRGQISNTATATGTPPAGGNVTSAPSTAVVTATASPSISLVKSASPVGALPTAGNTVTYSFVVTNTGNVTLTNPTVTETQFSGAPPVVPSCPPTPTLAPQGQMTCTATYTVTTADFNAGQLTNTAVASGTTPGGATVTSPPASTRVPATQSPSIGLVKSAAPSTVTAAGQTVTFSYVITNTGNVTLTGAVVNETAFTGTGPQPTPTCNAAAASLIPGAQATCTATYTVLQADMDRGQISNSATATGTPPTGANVTSPTSTAVVTAAASPSISLVKSASPLNALPPAGQTISYTFVVTNTGNVTLSNPTVTETQFSGAPPVVPSCPATPTLAPQAQMTCTATYTVTLADVNAGVVTNTAVATGTPPTGPAVTSPPSATRVPGTQTPAITLVKTASPTTVSAAGQTVTFSYLITNTGNVTLAGGVVNETAFTGAGPRPVPTCTGAAASLIPGAQATCTATYTVLQADIDAGKFSNTATATGTPPSGPNVTSAPSTVTVTATASASISLVKSASPVATLPTPGNTVTYSFVVTNTGNVTLTNPTVTETQFSGAPPVVPNCPATPSLPPQGQMTCSATYTVTTADFNAGKLTNTAVATATTPGGATVTSPPSSTQVPATQAPALKVVKSASPTIVTTVGQTVTYTFVVTNTGNVTLTNVGVTETQFSGTGTAPAPTCPAAAASMLPGIIVTCTATYTVTSADLSAGSITNTAHASATTPAGGSVVSDPSSAAVTTVPPVTPPPTTTTSTTSTTAAPVTTTTAVSPTTSVAPTPTTVPVTTTLPPPSPLIVTKVGTPVDTNHDGVIDVGDQINWAIQVTNAGASPVSGISISDPTAGTVTCPQTTLTPGQSMTCTPPPHAITSADAAAGGVTNTATAAGSFNGGGITSASSTRVPVAGAAAGAGGSTAFTGLETVKLLLIGLGLVLLGLLLVVLFRRRRSSV